MSIIVDTTHTADKDLLEHPDLPDRQLGKRERAAHTARRICGDKKRASGDDAITHPLGVEKIIVKIGYRRDVIMRCGCILHDVLEDCKKEEREELRRQIRRHFGFVVYIIVEALTRKPNIDYADQMMRAIKKWWWIGAWRIALIKPADGIFNFATIRGFGNYTQEMRQFYKAYCILRKLLIPARRYIPRREHPKYDVLVREYSEKLPRLHSETIAYYRESERETDLGYFPVL